MIFENNECFSLEDLNTSVLSLIEKIRSPFDKLMNLVNNGLPIFYKTNSHLLSRQQLQQERFEPNYFIYYLTKYRQELYQKITELCENKNIKISITGLQCSGKSYFLADFVLRQRTLGKNSMFRILYINDSKAFLSDPNEYMFIELLSALCFDFELVSMNNENLTEINELPKKINSQKEILECLIFFKRKGINSILFQTFLQLLKSYYEFDYELDNIKIKKKLILVWDQLNDLFKNNNDPEEPKIFNSIDNSNCFHCRLVSASNINQNIPNRNSNYNIPVQFEINPFLCFANYSKRNEKELFELILAEAAYFHPKDITEIKMETYARQLFKYLNESIIEYFYYKKEIISSITFEKAKIAYFENRKNSIRKLEINFQNEYFKNYVELLEYYTFLRKIITYEEYLELKTKTEEVKVYFL